MKYELRRGDSSRIYVADVEGNIDHDPVLTLTVRHVGCHEMPSVKVEEEHSGFQAEIQSVSLTSTDGDTEESNLNSYEIALSWAGGADFLTDVGTDRLELSRACSVLR